MTIKHLSAFRVRFVNDDDAHFEECNGEARPLTRDEYAENQYMGCPVHPRTKVPSKVKPGFPGVGICGECGREFQPIPYAEYLDYFGNPERHIYLGCIVEKQCRCCGSWDEKASLWGIDFMDDSPEWLKVKTGHNYSASEALALPGYLAEVARDELHEAGYKLTASAYCAKRTKGKRCTYFHVAGSKFCAQHGGR